MPWLLVDPFEEDEELALEVEEFVQSGEKMVNGIVVDDPLSCEGCRVFLRHG